METNLNKAAWVDLNGHIWLNGRIVTERQLARAYSQLHADHWTCVQQFNEQFAEFKAEIEELQTDLRGFEEMSDEAFECRGM